MRPIKLMVLAMALTGASCVSNSPQSGDDPWVVYTGDTGPGRGKHIVLVSGDEEYRSEEALPQLGKILARHHGFRCTVLFAIDPETGEIDPNNRHNIPGLEALEDADLMVVALRFRDLPEGQMQHIVDYVEAGKPVMGMRTATHAFHVQKHESFRKYDYRYRGADYKNGFGRQVLGETWIRHHGAHGRESTRGLIADGAADHPIVRGITDGDIWGPTDVYGVTLPLPGDSKPIVMGQVLAGMEADDEPVAGRKNDPMMPIAWTKTYKGGRVFTTTMGSSTDLMSDGTRRLLVNGVYWCVGLEDEIVGTGSVELVGEFAPRSFGFDGFERGVKPSDLRMR